MKDKGVSLLCRDSTSSYSCTCVWGVGVREEVVLSTPVNSLTQWSIDLGVKLAVANISEQYATFELGMLIASWHMPTC